MSQWAAPKPSTMTIAEPAIQRARFVLSEMGECRSGIGLSCFIPAAAQCLKQTDDGVQARELDLKQGVLSGKERGLGIENRQYRDGTGAKLSGSDIKGSLGRVDSGLLAPFLLGRLLGRDQRIFGILQRREYR